MNFQQLEYFLAAFDRGSFSAAAEALHLAQPSRQRAGPRAGGRARRRALHARRPRPAADRGGPRAAPARRARRCTPSRRRATRSSPCASCAAARRRSASGATRASTRAWTSSPTSAVATRRARPAARPELRRGGRGAALRRGRGRHGRPADRRPRARRAAGHARRDRLRLARARRGCAGRSTISASRRRRWSCPTPATGAAGPDAPPARRARPARGRSRSSRRSTSRTSSRRWTLVGRGHGDTFVSHGSCAASATACPRRLGWAPFAEPLYDTFAFAWRRGAQLSPAAREFLALAEERLAALACSCASARCRAAEHPRRKPRRRRTASPKASERASSTMFRRASRGRPAGGGRICPRLARTIAPTSLG